MTHPHNSATPLDTAVFHSVNRPATERRAASFDRAPIYQGRISGGMAAERDCMYGPDHVGGR